MLKIILCILLVTLCSCAGFVLARKYKQRKIFATDLQNFNERFINEVGYTRVPLATFFEKYQYGEDFTALLSALKECDFREIRIEYTYLTEEQTRLTSDYFRMIGKSDAKTQRDYLNAVRIELEKNKTEAEAEYKKRFTLYMKLGFLLGLVLAILLV